jgi:very-short-patch-repair endonuclease
VLAIYEKTALMLNGIFGIIFERIDSDLNLRDSVDFLCLEKRLIIELDGAQHMDNKIYDTKRTEWLMAHRFNVLRFWNHDVFQQTPSILEVIMTALL